MSNVSVAKAMAITPISVLTNITCLSLENGELETDDEDPVDESMAEDHEDVATMGELLVARRSLSIMAESRSQEQRENLFHTRCLVQGKMCSPIINGGSCTNVASKTMVTILKLPRTPHPKPYKLQWLSNHGEITVSHQMRVPLTIGKYEDEVECDILPMKASHILLGQPWESDRRVIHDGFSNRHSFEFKGRKTTLIPMTPKEVYQDQIKCKLFMETSVRRSNFFAKRRIACKATGDHPKLLFVFKGVFRTLTN